jgi:uncharacterized iron-regulated protein
MGRSPIGFRPPILPMRFLSCLIALACLAGCAAPRLILAEHPLAGRVWDVALGRFLPPPEAEERIAAADIALLGEIHDNPAHHQIQARLLRQAIARGKRPALAMEQFDTDWQSAIDAARKAGATTAAIAQAGRISSGWEWPLYQPLVLQALRERLPIVAANLSRERARGLASGGHAALGEGEARRLALDRNWSAEQGATLRRMLVDGHCGQDDPMIDRLVPVQRAKDAVMADRILGSGNAAVAIIGRSHARKDIGVPLYLRERAPEKRLVSLGLVEVEAGLGDPAAYPDAAPGLHDLVWFTPRALRPDPCAGFRKIGHSPRPGS